MNYMDEVAKVLGVELGELFEVYRNEGYFCLTYNGLINQHTGRAPEVLSRLLSGDLHIKRKPWKPNANDIFWSINASGNADWSVWVGATQQLVCYKIGNCYHTEEEAVANIDKWMGFYASDEVLEV